MQVLVTGGAGYIGSVVAEQLSQAGYSVVVVDTLEQGHRDAVPPQAELVVGNIADTSLMNEIFSRWHIDGVMHLAAYSLVGVSMSDPGKFFRNNVSGGIYLLDAMVRHGVQKMIFSSSAAVYGNPVRDIITENDEQSPVNPYGETKLIYEKILSWYARAYSLRYVSLRYFNAAGATEHYGEIHEPETHLVPNVIKACIHGTPVTVFGLDYPTRDGSCIRDYVHVVDIAQAHITALENIDRLGHKAYNLGNGNGYSVLEVIDAVRRVCKKPVATITGERRAGDPAVLVASADLARKELGWSPRFGDIDSIIASVWRWTMSHPSGYSQ